MSTRTASPPTGEFNLPTVEMPLPAYGMNRHLPEIHRPMYAWAAECELTANPAMLRHMERTRPDLTTAYYYPTVSLERLVPLCQYMLWAFIVDDTLDDAISVHDVAGVAENVAGIIRAVDGDPAPDSPSTRACRDLFTTLFDGRSADWGETLRAEVAAWLGTYITEAAATRLGRVMSLEEYIPHRRYGVDEISFILLAEYGHDIDLPDRVRHLPALADARARGAEWVGLYNDIYSAEKEAAVGYHHNAVLITAHDQRCSLQEAAETVNAVLTRLISQFQSALARVPAELADLDHDEELRRDVAQVVEGYRKVVRGNFDYHINQPRYADAAIYLPREQQPGIPRPLYSTDGILPCQPKARSER